MDTAWVCLGNEGQGKAELRGFFNGYAVSPSTA